MPKLSRKELCVESLPKVADALAKNDEFCSIDSQVCQNLFQSFTFLQMGKPYTSESAHFQSCMFYSQSHHTNPSDI